MKKLFLLLLAPIMLFGCNEDADPVRTLIGDWDLVSIKHGWTGEELIGTENTYLQTYQFKTNGTFTKTQKMGDQVLQANGIYITSPGEILSSADVKLNIELDFTGGDEIAGDCTNQATESLILRNNNQLINTWGMCDGPSLTYEKK